MQGIKNLVYILFLPVVFLFLIIFAVEQNDFERLRASLNDNIEVSAGHITALIKDMAESGGLSVSDPYPMYDIAKRHGIYRIIVLTADGIPVNDTQSKDLPSKYKWLLPAHIKEALEGKAVFFRIKDDRPQTAVSLRRVSQGGKEFILAVIIKWPHEETQVSGAVIAVSAGGILLLVLLLASMRAYLKSEKTALKAGDLSEVDFVVETFHGLVASLKDKERQLEVLRRLAEERADIIEGYNENILESVPSGVISINESLLATKMNSAAERILSIKREDMLGKDPSKMLKGQIGELITGGETIRRGELQYTASSGKRMWLGYMLTPLFDAAGKAIGRLFIFTDLTELKALQSQAELRQRLSSLGEMAAGIAHELRNPMAVIAGYVNLLGKRVDDPLRETVNAVSKEVSLMDAIINDFLSFARPRELDISEVNLHAVIEESVKGIASGRGDIEVSLDLDKDLKIQGDIMLIRQAFTNLIQNSVEAMPEGGKVSVSCSTDAESVSITFSDTGHGIPPAIRDRIFLPFYTTKEKGTGLGLAMVHRIIASHGGTIEAEPSGEGKGTAFRIRLPLRQG